MRAVIAIPLLFLCAFVGTSAYALSGLTMMAVEAGARPVGMGGAFTAITADPYSAAYNPSATWGITALAGSFGYNTHWENTRIETGYLTFEKRSVTITAGIQFAAVDKLEGRTEATADYIEFSAHDVSLKLGAAFELEKNYILGFSLGWMYEKIDVYDGSAFNFDLGLLMQPHQDLNIGLAVLNFGSTMKIREESYDLPTSYRGGISYKFNRFISAVDLVSKHGDIHLHFGGEYNLDDRFFLRGGYRFGYDTKDFSAGVGFSKRNLRIDYAFLPHKGGLSDSHLFNLTFEI